jgi:hypothetical protein
MRHIDHPVEVIKRFSKYMTTDKLFFDNVEKLALGNVESKYELWNPCIFIPYAGWHWLLEKNNKFREENEDKLMSFANDLCIVGSFMYSKDMYEFDETLLNSLIKTPIDTVNINSLMRLPNKCLYVDLKGKLELDGKKAHGFYAAYNDDISDARISRFTNIPTQLKNKYERIPIKISIRILWDDNERDNIYEASIPLVDGKLSDAIDLVIDFKENVLHYHSLDKYSSEIQKLKSVKNMHVNNLSSIIPILLYLCSDEPDIKDSKCDKIKLRPYYDKDKPKRIFSPSVLRTWNVGKEVGKAIRSQKASFEKSGITPHLRRAHWHGFWKGPREGEREFFYKWIPPIFVTSQTQEKT